MSKTNANVFENAKCVGRWNLFDSTSVVAHKEAADLCDRCPARQACERRRDRMTEQPSGFYAEGTWAGVLLGSKAAVRDVA